MSSAFFTPERLRRRRGVGLGLALAGVALLAGCTPTATDGPTGLPTAPATSSRPAPTASAETGAVGAPSSEKDAVAAATTAFTRYNDLENLINREQGANAERIDAVASGQAKEAIVSRDWSAPSTYEGGITVDVLSSYALDATADSVTIPFGSVGLTFCNDDSTRTVTNADGSVRPSQQPITMEAAVQYVPASSAWKVSSIVIEGEPC